MNQNKLLTFL